MKDMLKRENLVNARNKAKEIREQYNLTGPGVDLNELIDNFNNSNQDIQIVASELDLSELEKHYKKPLSGFIKKMGNKVYIGVARDEPAFRKRFTLAHELGHFFLGHNTSQIEFRQNIDALALAILGYYPYNDDEQEANEFAGELLMPEEEVKQLYNLVKDSNKLSKIFGVSYQAMKVRLTRLGLI